MVRRQDYRNEGIRKYLKVRLYCRRAYPNIVRDGRVVDDLAVHLGSNREKGLRRLKRSDELLLRNLLSHIGRCVRL